MTDDTPELMLSTEARSAAQPRADFAARVAALIVLSGMVVSISFGLRSDGLHQLDDLTHYLFARWSWTYPQYLLNEWGRPGFTAPYCIPARFGWPAARLFSALLSAAAAWLAFRIAQRMQLRLAWCVPLLLYAQPLFFQLSLTTLTETPLALYLTAAVYLAQRGRWSVSSAVLSLGLITRHEAIVLLPVWILAAWRERTKLVCLLPLVWAPVAVNALAPLAGWRPPVALYFHAHPLDQYGNGGWLTYFCRSMEAWGPAVSALGFAGLLGLFRRAGGSLIAGSAAAYFAAETTVRALGAFESGGYPRFLVPISPLMAIAAASCLERLNAATPRSSAAAGRSLTLALLLLWGAMERQLVRPETPAFLPEITVAKWTVRIVTAIVVCITYWQWASNRRRNTTDSAIRAPALLLQFLLAVLAVLTCRELCGVLRIGPGEKVVVQARDWLVAHGYSDRPLVTAHMYMVYLNGDISPPHAPCLRDQLANCTAGTIVMWDRQFAASKDHDVDRRDLENTRSFRLLFAGDCLPYQTEPQVRLYEKIGPWP